MLNGSIVLLLLVLFVAHASSQSNAAPTTTKAAAPATSTLPTGDSIEPSTAGPGPNGQFYSQRDAFLYAFVLGPLGAHRFYLRLWLSAGFQLALTVVFCFINLIMRCCITRTDEEKAVLKALVICTFGCSVTAWWIIDWATIAAGVLRPADGFYNVGFESN